MAQYAYNEQNPIGLNGVEFIEYTGPQPQFFEQLFVKWGFTQVAKSEAHQSSLHRQNRINFIVTEKIGSFANQFHKTHGPSICSTGFRVFDQQQAFKEAVARGARPFTDEAAKGVFAGIPAVYGIGDSLIYLIDPAATETLYSRGFAMADTKLQPQGCGFEIVDHFTNNVPVGEMQKWCDFYTQTFNFKETRYFDIKGKNTGLISKVMRSPCGQFSVPINEPSDPKSQIQEYLNDYKGSGIQHLALLTPNILSSLAPLKKQGLEFLTPPPNTYYKMLTERLPQVTESIGTLEKEAVLVDGDHDGYLLQIFSKNIIGPIFFEVIQRKGHSGFGEGNFQALFDAIERDQRERGYL